MKVKKVIRNSQHGFAKHKSCLTDLTSFCDEMAVFVKKRRVIDGWMWYVLTLTKPFVWSFTESFELD